MKKILLICSESASVINFRKDLILYLKKHDYDVDLIVSDDHYINEIKKIEKKVYLVPFSNRSTNPFTFSKIVKQFKKIIKISAPQIVFTFQLKPNIFGTIAASKYKGIKIFNMVEGLGDPFKPENFKGRVIRSAVSRLYRKAFKYSNGVFFLNSHDIEELISRKVIKKDKTILIDGIGIDTTKYVPTFTVPKEKHVVFLARLIRNKGIIEFCKVAQITRKTRKDIYFDLYGSEGQLTKKDLLPYIEDKSITYHGYSDRAKEVIANSTLLLSTSRYREGLPRIILEAMALGKPVIASDIIGNKDVVQDGVTGYLVDVDDLDGFSRKIIELVDNEQKIIELGKNARNICVKRYDSKVINDIIFEIINK